MKVKSLSRVRPSATPWTAAHQASPSMGFSRQEYWSGVPLPSPRRGSIMIKSNPTAPGWVNHKLKNNYITVSFTEVKVLSPTSGSLAWGSGIRRRSSQSIFFFFLNHQFNFMNWSHVTHCQTSLKFLANYTEPLFSR